MSINLGGLKTSAQDGTIELNKTAMALDKYAGIDVTKPGGELMDTMEILTKLSSKWDGFTKQTKVGLGEAIAGKYHSNVFNALMDNFETVKNIQQEIANGQALGSADKENKRFIDSIEGRVVKLKEELKKLATTTISTDMTKGFVSGLTSMVSGINNVIGAFDKLGMSTPVVLSALTGMFMTIKSLGTGTQLPNFAKTISNLATSGSSLNKIQSNLRSTSTQFTTLNAGATKYSGSLRVASSSSEKFNNSIRNNGVVATKSANGLTIMSKTASQAKSSLSGMGSMLSGIGSTLLTTFGNMAIMAVAGIAISKITQALYEFAHASEISMEKHEENISKINTKISELKTQKSSLKSIAKEYDELTNKTNRSAKEQERYNELRNQIAEANPELQVGTDKDGNAILSLNGTLKEYVKNLNSAIDKQKILLQQQQNAEAGDASDQLQKGGNVAFGYDYKNYEKSSKIADEEKSKIEKSGSNLTNAIRTFTATSEDSFKGSIDKIRTAREEHSAQIEESYNKVVEEQEKIDQLSTKIKQKAFNKVESNDQLKDAKDNIKTFARDVTASLDFSSLKTGQVDTYARNLSKSLSDGKIDGVLAKYQSLRKELETTGDTFTYQSSVQSLVPEMAKLLGVNEEVIQSMIKVPPTMTQATSSLDAYLQSFGKRESMKGFDTETDNLIKQYESFNSFIDDLGNLDAQEVNGEVVFDIEAVAEIVNQDEMPKQVKDLFAQMQSDGKFTDEEMKVMMQISTAMTTTDSSEREKLLASVQQWVDETFPNSEIDVGELGVKAELNFDAAKFNEDLGGILKGEKNQQIRIDIETAVQFGDVKTLQDKLKQLPEKKQVEIINSIQQAGGMTPEQLKQLINGLPDNVKKQITVSTPGADESNGKLNQVDKNSQNKNKQVKTSAPGADDTISKEKQVDKNSGNKSKSVSVSAPGASSTANILHDINSNSYNRSFTVTTIFKTIGKKVTDFFGSGYQPPVIKNTGGFSNISDTPQEASAMSSGFSGVSDSPTVSASSPTPTTSIPSGVSGQVSAKSTGSFGSVLTSSTMATKISTSLKNVWNTLKYGINLFQELENRISRTQNQLDLLSSKMENAIGTKKISYLKTQNKLYTEQAKLQKTLFNSLNKEKSAVSKKLKGFGFKINKQGNLTQYEETLVKLEKAAEAAEKKSSGYKGKSDKKKNSLEKSADKAKQKLDDAKKLTEEYLKLQYTDIPNAEKEWQDLKNAIKETNNEIEQLNFSSKIYKEVHKLDELSEAYDRLNNHIERNNIKAERYNGAKKIKYMKEEMKLSIEASKKQKEIAANYASQRYDYQAQLKKYGVKFDKDGEISNQQAAMYKLKNSADYDKVKKWIDEYIDLEQAERDAKNTAESLINSSIDLGNEIKKLELEQALSPFTSKVDESNSKIKKLQNNLDIISVKMEHAYGNDKLNLIKEQIKLYEQLDKEQKASLENMKKQEDLLKKELENNGFKFNSNGDITNMKDALDKVKDSSAFEYIKEVLEQWKDLHEDEIPDANKSIKDFQNSIKDAYKNQLEVTKDIEGKISDMIKKQIEDRKEAIQKETDTIKKELEKRKKAHQDARKEAEYQNEYDEKTSEIDDLKKQLETAKKDPSLGNRKKIAELEKQLADAQKELDKIVDDKLNSDIEDAFDDAIEGVEDENDKKIEDLEKEWTDSKIAEAIKNALDTGIKCSIYIVICKLNLLNCWKPLKLIKLQRD